MFQLISQRISRPDKCPVDSISKRIIRLKDRVCGNASVYRSLFLIMIFELLTCGRCSRILPQRGRPRSGGRVGRRCAADAAQGGIQAGIQTGIQAQRGRERPGGNGSQVGRTILPSRPSAVHQGGAAYRHGRAGACNGDSSHPGFVIHRGTAGVDRPRKSPARARKRKLRFSLALSPSLRRARRIRR